MASLRMAKSGYSPCMSPGMSCSLYYCPFHAGTALINGARIFLWRWHSRPTWLGQWLKHMSEVLLFLMAPWAAEVMDPFTSSAPYSPRGEEVEAWAFRASWYSPKLVNLPIWILWLLAGWADMHVVDLPWSPG